MSSTLKIYKLKDFIRKTESGNLDYDRIKEIVNELGTAASFYTKHNILLDFRGTTLSVDSMSDIMTIALEIESYKKAFNNKIANVLPNDEDRLSMAKKWKTVSKS